MSITVRYGSRLTADPSNPGMFLIDSADAPADPGLYVLGTYYGPAPAERTLVGFSWGGIDFTQWGPYYITKIDGWDSPPDGKTDEIAILGRHGARLTRMTRGSRSVTIEGFCLGSDRDDLFNALADALAAGFGDGDGTTALIGDVAGRSLTAEAQLKRYKPTVEQVNWGALYFGWAIEFYCPDPARYGTQTSTTVPVAVPTQGITFGVSGSWVFPADPVGGVAVMNNPGNALSDAVFTLSGPISRPGVAVVETGAFVTFDFDLAVGDSLTVDTAQGLCALNGVYRSPSVLSSLLDELRLPPNATSTVQALGSPQSGSPSLSVTVRPAYW